MKTVNIFFWRVDLQRDFLNKNGKVFIKGSSAIKRNIKALSHYAWSNNIIVFGSVDAHVKNDPEFRTRHPHAIIGTYGFKEIREALTPRKTRYVKNSCLSDHELRDLFNKSLEKDIIFEKPSFSVFTSRAADKFISKYIKGNLLIIYGVATDYCIKETVNGMLKRGIKVLLVSDAIKERRSKDEVIKEMKRNGAVLIRTKEVIKSSKEQLIRKI